MGGQIVRRVFAIASIVVVTVSLALPSFASEPDATHFGRFSSQGLRGDDGTLEFNGPWIEIGESNGPTSGYVWVWDHEYCDGTFCLRMGGDDGAAGHGAYRAVDLTGATWAKLHFDYGRALLDENSEGTAVVQVSSDGGDEWTTVKTIRLDKDDGSLKFHMTIVISDWATADTMIRFMITEAEDLKAYWLIGNVTVEASFEETTTTSAESPTTTTEAPVETTTTTKPPAITTTTEPRSTTTTEPERTHEVPVYTTTTTTLPATVTTVAPSGPGTGISSEDHDTMMEKTGLVITSAMPPTGLPASMSAGDTSSRRHAKPVEALVAAFFTDSGDYGWNLLAAVGLGMVIAVVSLLGIGSRRQD
jgi:hypothetical protein